MSQGTFSDVATHLCFSGYTTRYLFTRLMFKNRKCFVLCAGMRQAKLMFINRLFGVSPSVNE